MDAFGGWTFADAMPDLFLAAQQAYRVMAPLAWLVGGISLATLVITMLINITRRAVGRADDE